MSDRHRFDPTVLREYDIRGVVGRTLSAADAGVEARRLLLYASGKVESALVLGFGTVPPRAADEAARRLARIIEATRRNA